MYPSNRILGLAGICGAPFLLLQMLQNAGAGPTHTSLGALFDLVYMLGWTCSVWGLLRSDAVRRSRTVVTLLCVQLALLCIANAWNVWVMADPGNTSTLFFVLDACWPLSNVCLLVIGIVTAARKTFGGWRRYAVLTAGLWLPTGMLVITLLGRTTTSFWIGGLYSTFAWAAMGWAVVTTPGSESYGKTETVY